MHVGVPSHTRTHARKHTHTASHPKANQEIKWIIIRNLCKLLSNIILIIIEKLGYSHAHISGTTKHLDKTCKYLSIRSFLAVEVAGEFSGNCLRLQAGSRIPKDAKHILTSKSPKCMHTVIIIGNFSHLVIYIASLRKVLRGAPDPSAPENIRFKSVRKVSSSIPGSRCSSDGWPFQITGPTTEKGCFCIVAVQECLFP